jgi:hypothetical protein
MLSTRQTRPTAGGVLRRSRSARAHPVEALETRTLLAADVVISEFMAANKSTVQDNYLEYSDWIELHNRGDAAQNLDGWFVTDSSTDLTQWRLPAVSLAPGAYLTVYASEKDDAVAGQPLHTNFKLDAGGEYLALVRPDGLTVQHEFTPAYPDQTDDISYGLSFERTAGSFEKQYFTQPTPGAANIPNVPEPTFSVRSKTFTGTLSVALSSPLLPGAQIRYTTNRTVPTETSTLYTGPISVTNTTMIRARAFAAGRTPSPVVTETYYALDASVSSFNSNLPLVVLDTFGAGVAESPQTMVGSYIIDTAADDGRAAMLDAPDFAGRAGLNVRGQSSAGFEKHQYHFELWDESNRDKGAPLLGMPSDSDWVLYAPYSEKTLMQNYLAYMWSNRLGQYAVRTRYVEVFMNTAANGKIDYAGDYLGVYILMEKIKVDDNRVDVAKLGPSDSAAPDVTGGYIFAKDKPDPGEAGFSAAGNDFRYVDPGPLDITAAQKTYLSNYLNEFYSVLNGANFADPVNGYAKYIDVDSFIDQHILTELTKNIDGFRISAYYSKDRNGKIKMGPAWDFNLSLGNADYNNGWISTGWYHDLLGDYDYPFFRRLFQDPNFQQKYIDRWQEIRRGGFSNQQLNADIDGLVSLLSDGNGNYPVGTNPPQAPNNPVVRNFQKWHILGVDTWPNWYTDPAWINQVNWMKDWLRQRVEWWDSQYLAAPAITPPGGPVTSPTQVTITSTGGQSVVDTSIVPLRAPAKAIVPTGDIGTSWRDRVFDDSGWISGTTGVGYDADPPGGGGDYTADLGLLLTMRNVNSTAYVRIPFTVTNPASVQSLILKMKYDDGFVAYLNGTEIYRTSNAPATLDWQSPTVNNATHNATGFEEFDVSAFKNLLVPASQGSNVLAIQALNAGAGSSDLLVLPELVSRAVTTTAAPVYYTTDGTDPRRPDGSISPTAQLYTGPFTVSTTARVMARSRLNNRWSGLASQLYDFGTNRLRITEIMYNPAPASGGSYLPGDFEYVELMNTGSQPMNLRGSRFTNGIDFTFGDYTLNAGARVLVVRNQAAFESRYGTGKPTAGTYTGALSDGGERIRLLGTFGEVVHDFTYSDGWYPQTDGQGWSLTIVDPNGALTAWNTKAGWRASEPANGTPGATDSGLRPNSVVINEIMTNPSSGGDWIELLNTTGSPVDIGNWWLSDTPADLKKWRIPAGTSVPANGYLVFTQTQFGSAFSFSSSGEGVYLSSGDAAGSIGGYRADETFGAANSDVPFGRTPLSTGGADFTALVSPTQGGANSAPVVGPVVINEIMYNPLSGKSEYIELRNITGSAVNLYDGTDTWKFSGGIDWAFPAGTSIPANGYLILSAVDPATFRTQYSVPAGVQVLGPYTLPDGTNVLANGGESIRLMRPAVATGTPRLYVTVDRVAYDDDAPWPAETSGTGQSLGRINSAAYGNDPGNWGAELFGGSPGRPNLDNVAPTADVVDITPDPRTTAVASVTIAFSEAVTGFDLADLRLTRNGSVVPFAGTETLATSDGGLTWTLGNLSTLTSAPGTYALTLVAAGSGIVDGGGRSINADASDTWVTNPSDTSAPSADIVDVAPDPRNTSVASITIVFSEPVTGFDRSDLSLKRNNTGNDLLTASHSLATSDGGRTWTLSGLNGVTGTGAVYTLTLKGTGTGITDLAGNPLAGGAVEQWVVDNTAPTADVVDVIPALRSTPVSSITIAFSEAVTGVNLADLRLQRDGGPNLLTAAQTVTTSDGGDTWVLGNLSGLTAASGGYVLRLVTAGSGITDVAGNALSTVDPSAIWNVDATPPVVAIQDVTPDPRTAPVDSLMFVFSEPVTGLDLLDLQFVRSGDATNLLTAAQTVTTSDGGVTWVLGNLGAVTGAPGTYTLTLVAGVSGIADAAGNSLQSDASEVWTMDNGAPTVSIADVTPNPRPDAVGSVTIVFSEPVTGFDLADLRFGKNDGANLLTAAQTLTTTDGGRTWTLGNLTPLQNGDGNYSVSLPSQPGNGITDLAGNPVAGEATETWTVDATPPTADIVDVTPDPRDTPVDSITIVFSEPVTGFDLSDLRLRREDIGNTLTDAQTLTTSDGITWVLGNLGGLTPPGASYELTLVAEGSGIRDGAGNALATGASDAWGESPVGPPEAVYVRGSAWSSAFKSYMETIGVGDDVYGYRIDDKTGDQQVLPWVNVNEIVVRYALVPSGAGIPTPANVSLVGDRAGADYAVTAVQQLDPRTFVLSLDRPLGNLAGGGENGVRVNLTVPNTGIGGVGHTSMLLRALQGDVTHAGESSHIVIANDASDIKPRFFRSTSSVGPAGPTQYTVFHDLDGSGNILANDFSFVKARFFDSLQTTAFPVVAAVGDGSVQALSGDSVTKDLFASTPIL